MQHSVSDNLQHSVSDSLQHSVSDTLQHSVRDNSLSSISLYHDLIEQCPSGFFSDCDMNVVYLSDSVTQECLSHTDSSDVSEPCSLLTAARAVPSQEDLLLSNLRTSGSALDEPVSPVIPSHEDVLLSNVRTRGSDLARPASRVISSGEDVMLSDLRTSGMDFDSSAVKLLNELSVCTFVTDSPADRPTPSVADFASWHARVRQSGVPNFKSERIPVPTKLHVSAWRGLLDGFHDTVLCDFLEFGFPVNYESSAQPRVPRTNHPSALQYSSHVDRFISTELSHGATIGPLSPATFSPGLVCNPLQTVPKKASPDRRIVVDFSYPPGSSVNDGIPTGTYLGQPHRLRYPSMDDFIALVVNWAGSRIVVMCDNEASVTVLNSGRSRSPFLQTCLRNLWLCAAVGQFELRAIHIPGLENRLADHLSRWTSSNYHQNEFLRLSAHMHVCEVEVSLQHFDLLTQL
ncbi:PREDICTED: uncharacterized protein LOC109477693 [Branchiostoma belcheri]|uniref:Uncharacterized protein LOC109477693 n=2 Tax=Branchiostoma belcheri TaxID=7741 RepID=A0A6P4ZKU0_BRABE|nr:PREDICTED: uncharacterized protein LOC109477693 [Branchiostoma belcheri]